MSESDIKAIRAGLSLEQPKHEALRLCAQQVVRERGRVSEQMLEAFTQAGWTSQQVLEVILAVSIKTMSNYTNAMARVPLDAAVEEEV